MRDEREAKIFSRNINNYIAASGKTQKEVAKALGFNPTTFNTWCVGKIMPSLGKVQKIADYFGVGKSALLDEIPEEMKPMPVVTGKEMDLIRAYRIAPDSTKEAICVLLNLKGDV